MRLFALFAALLLAASAGRPVDPNAACAALVQPISAGAIGLPTNGATMESAARDAGFEDARMLRRLRNRPA